MPRPRADDAGALRAVGIDVEAVRQRLITAFGGAAGELSRGGRDAPRIPAGPASGLTQAGHEQEPREAQNRVSWATPDPRSGLLLARIRPGDDVARVRLQIARDHLADTRAVDARLKAIGATSPPSSTRRAPA